MAEDFNRDRSRDDDAGHIGHSRPPGGRLHRLAADMEGYAQFVRIMAGFTQDLGRVFCAGTEFTCQRQSSTVTGYSDPYNDRKVLGVAGFLEDLVQFLHRVGDKNSYTKLVISALDGAAVLHRVQEGHAGAREFAMDQFDLWQRCRIETAYASFPEGFEHMLARVRLHGIEWLARELFLEPFCGCSDPLRAETPYRQIGLLVGNNIIGSSIGVHDT